MVIVTGSASAGRFLIWFTAWSLQVTGLDIWCAAEDGEKLMRFMWAKGGR